MIDTLATCLELLPNLVPHCEFQSSHHAQIVAEMLTVRGISVFLWLEVESCDSSKVHSTEAD